jgi:hypothetical protein
MINNRALGHTGSIPPEAFNTLFDTIILFSQKDQVSGLAPEGKEAGLSPIYLTLGEDNKNH